LALDLLESDNHLYPRRMTKSAASGPSRLEKILAYMGASVIGLSLVSIFIALIGSYFELKTIALFAQIPLLGLPIGFISVMLLLILALRRKGRENKQ
jgi:hypothetical protein